MNRIRLACGCLALLLTLAPVIAQEKRLAPRSLPGGGVIDPADKVGYFPNPTGGIDALDLANGAVLWSSKDANVPLFATENRLYAMKGADNKVRVIALDTTKKGAKVVESTVILLPDWATVSTVHGRSFQPGARLGADGFLFIWEARAFYAGGAAPPPEVVEQSRKQATGVARIDVETGKTTILDAKQVAAGKFFPLPEQMMLIVGDFKFQTTEEPAKNPRNPQQERRFLEALNGSMEVVWRREIAAPVNLLPLP